MGNTWFIYGILALLILPFSTEFISIPGLRDIYSQGKSSVIRIKFLM